MKNKERFFWIVLLTISAVLFFVLVPLCIGAEPLHVTISGPVPPQPTRYPAEVYNMTDAEFFRWATDQNKQARAEWEKWYKNESQPRWISYGVTTDYEQSRRGSYFGSNYEQGSIRTYEGRSLNPGYTYRPLTVINPFCRPAIENKQCTEKK